MSHRVQPPNPTDPKLKEHQDAQLIYKARQRANKSNSLDYKGMTLKEYFRLSDMDGNGFGCEIKETEEENVCSSNEANTPCFNQYNYRQKIKTEMFEDKIAKVKQKGSNSHKQKNFQMLSFQNKTKHLRTEKPTDLPTPKPQKQAKTLTIQLSPNPVPPPTHSHSPNPTPHYHPLPYPQPKLKNAPINTLALIANKAHLNRSTVTSFYQLEAKKKKMLDKLKMDKERINQFKLSDVCFITKYGDKFCGGFEKGY